MPEKNHNQKMNHNLGIPSCDDYFYEEPEFTLLEDKIPPPESTIQGITQIIERKKKRVINADVLIHR
jgi:hypothetical protein